MFVCQRAWFEGWKGGRIESMGQEIPNETRNGPPDDNHFQGFFAPIVGAADVWEWARGKVEHINAGRREFHGAAGVLITCGKRRDRGGGFPFGSFRRGTRQS